MKQTSAAALACCLLSVLPMLVRADQPQRSLLAETGWVRVQLVLGRIEVANIGSSQARTATRGEPSDGFLEKLTISAETVIPTVRYQKQSKAETMTFTIMDGRHVELRRTVAGDHPGELRFEQAPNRDVVLEVQRDEARQTYRSPSLWHLWLEQPDVCERELSAALEWLQPQWRLHEFINRAEDELVFAAARCEFNTARRARQLVARLDSPDYRTRQAALRDLQALGIGLLPQLERLDPADLSREQRQRLSHLKERLKADTSDTPERLASWLVEDERTWLALLEHREPAVRDVAVTHLRKRFPKTFGGSESSGAETVGPETQLRRIARLKAKYLTR